MTKTPDDIFGDNLPSDKKTDLSEAIRKEGFREGQALTAKDFNGLMEKTQKWVKWLESEKQRIENTAKSNKALIDNHKNVTDENKRLINENRTLIDNHKNITDNNSTLIDNHKKLTDENKRLIDENRTLIDNHKNITDNNSTLIDNHKKLTDENKRLIDENRTLIDNHKNITDNNSTLIDNHKKLTDENRTLIDDHKEIIDENKNSLEERMRDLEQKIKRDIGQIAYFPTVKTPANYLKLDGQTVYDAVANPEYLDLFNWIMSEHSANNKILISTGRQSISNALKHFATDITHSTFSSNSTDNKHFRVQIANGEKKFKVPNFQGVFLRVLEEGQGVNPDGANEKILWYRGDTFKSHRHELPIDGDSIASDTHYQSLIATNLKQGFPTDSNDRHYSQYNGSSETRPKNIQLCAFIRYR